MGGALEERYGVSITGASWDAGPFKLWGSQSSGYVLFSPKQPMLAKSLTTGRYQAACTQYRAQADGTYKIVGGGAAFTVTTALQFDEGAMQALKEQWRTVLSGDPDAPANPTFVPLNTRKGTTEMALPLAAGTVSPLTAKANDAGTPGGTVTYMVDLTPIGAQEWGDAIPAGRSPVAQVMMSYEYLRYMPTCAVEIHIDGNRVFQHFSGQLKASYDGWLYGSSVDIKAQFESLRANGAITMKFIGLDDLPAGMEKIKQSVTSTIIDQGMKAMLTMMFQPKPDVKPAEAGNAGGWFGGANLALKWQRSEESMNLDTKLEFGGFTWLTERADADLSMFAVLDGSYVNTVNTELQFPTSITVAGDPEVSNTAVAWTASEGQAPQSPVFTDQGGSANYIVTSKTPDAVTVDYSAKINFKPPRWPIVTTKGHGTIKDGFGNIIIKPSAWIGSTSIYLYVKDGATGGIKLIGDHAASGDYLVVNVSYSSPHLDTPLKDSARLTEDTPVTFSYPIDPAGRAGTAKFSAFGQIRGSLVHASEQPISLNESAVFVLINNGKVQLISGDAVIPETDALAKKLLARRDRVVVTGDARPEAIRATETEKSGTSGNGHAHIHGTVEAWELTPEGPVLVILSGGTRRRIRMLTVEQASSFTRKQDVDIELNERGVGETVRVLLSR